MKTLKKFLLFSLVFWLSACVQHNTLQMAAKDPDDYGIGGTGIIGEVTGFGSIFVNGIEIEPIATTTLSVNGVAVDHHRFEIGETVEVLTTDNQAYTDARKINIRHEIIGPLSAIDQEAKTISILNHKIHIPDYLSKAFRLGNSIAVSGYRDADGLIYATRIDKSESEKVLLRGSVEQIIGALSLQGISIDRTRLDVFKSENLVLQGRLDSQTLQIDSIKRDQRLPFTGVANWRIQGFPELYTEQWKAMALSRPSGNQKTAVVFELNNAFSQSTTVNLLETKSLVKGSLIRLNSGRDPLNSSLQRSRSMNNKGR